MMSFNVAGIPQELKDRKQWIVWRYEGNGEKKTKVPYIAATKNGVLTYRASSMNPKHWNGFEQALKVHEETDASGIGYVFSEHDPYAVADFDDALGEDGQIEPKVEKWLQALDTFTEISVSGKGFHVICKATIEAGASVAGYEVYDRGRYIAMTGNVWNDQKAIESRVERFRTLSERVREQQRKLEGRKNLERRRDAHRPFEGEGINLEDFLYDNRVSILREVGDSGGRKFQILCPWLSEHTGGDESGTFAGQFDDGALWFDCKHSHCAGRHWKEFRGATESENGLSEWSRNFKKNTKITVGHKTAGSATADANAQAAEDPEQRPTVPVAVKEFVKHGRFAVHDAIENGIDPPEELLRDVLLVGKAHTIFAPGGAGKTWVLVWIAKELVRQGKTVVVFDLENSGRTMSERFEEVGLGVEETRERLWYFDFPSLHPDVYEGVLDLLKPDLVMFDSWVGFLSADGYDENTATDIASWANLYIKPALRRGCATACLDHVPHEEDDRERGSTRKRDEVDVRWKLSKVGDFDRETTTTLTMWLKKDREGWLPPKLSFEVGGHAETGRFIMNRNDALAPVKIVRLSADERLILSVLEDSEKGLKAAEWQRACESRDIKKRDFYRAKSKLEDKGKVVKNEGVFEAVKPLTHDRGASGADLVHAPVAPDEKTGGSGLVQMVHPSKEGCAPFLHQPSAGESPAANGKTKGGVAPTAKRKPFNELSPEEKRQRFKESAARAYRRDRDDPGES